MDASMRPCVMRPASWVDLRVDRLIHSKALVLSSQKCSGSCFGEAQVRNTWSVVFFLSSVFFMGEKTIINLKKKKIGVGKKGEDVDFDVDLLFHMICLGRDLFLMLFTVCFSHFLVPSFIEQHDLGGSTKGGTILQFAESKQKNSHKDKPLKISSCKNPKCFQLWWFVWNNHLCFSQPKIQNPKTKEWTSMWFAKNPCGLRPLCLFFFKPKFHVIFLHQTPFSHHLWRPKINRPLPREPLQPDRVQEF